MPTVRGPRWLVLATVAFLAAGCGAPSGEAQGRARVPAALEQALREGRPARAIVLLDDAPALAAARALVPGTAALLADPADTATAALERTKASVLAGSGAAELEVLNHYTRLPALHVELRSAAALAGLLERPEVVRVVEDVPHQAFLAQSLPLIHQPFAAGAGATGRGTAVAVLDTGVDYTRSGFGTCPGPGAAGCRVAWAHDFAPDDGQLDAAGHGTNVAAIVAAVAPEAKILALDVFDGQYAYTSAILSAIDWCVQNRAAYGIVAINLSLGSGGATSPCSGDAFAGAIRAARAAGILTTAASGNGGQTDRIASPACVPGAISVGAVYDSAVGGIAYSDCADQATAADQVACFSNSASFLTVLAPGALITAGGSTMVGTSQAAPHVAGAVAALRSAFPSARLDAIVAALRAGPLITDPRNGVRTPRLDLTRRPALEVGGGEPVYGWVPGP